MKRLSLRSCAQMGALLCALSSVACSVDFEGYAFDDDALAAEENKNKPPEGASEECIDFCDGQEEICGFGEDFSYASKSECFTHCATYLEAELECRQTHLDFATNDKETHCRHTLLDGGPGTCPNADPISCDRFCLRTSLACSFEEDVAGVFPNFNSCRSACDAFSDGGLECRFVELGRAEEGDESTCPHLLADSEACSD